jgi:hypothetical protein
MSAKFKAHLASLSADSQTAATSLGPAASSSMVTINISENDSSYETCIRLRQLTCYTLVKNILLFSYLLHSSSTFVPVMPSALCTSEYVGIIFNTTIIDLPSDIQNRSKELYLFKLLLVCWCPATRAVSGHTFTYLPWIPSNPWGQGTLHARRWCGNPTARAGKTHPFTYLPLKTRNPWGQGTLHVRGYRGNLAM